MTNERKNITQPTDWWAAFEAEAKRRGLTLSEFIGLAASKMLAKDQKSNLSERVKPGRKKMKISEALEIANDIRNGCRNVGEASAIVTLADAIDVMSTAERNMLLGCERGEHKSCTVQFEDGTSLAFCELCGTHWPFDNAAKSKRAMWYASVVRTEVAKNIALIRSHESAPAWRF